MHFSNCQLNIKSVSRSPQTKFIIHCRFNLFAVSDGGLLVAASFLTNRYWTGKLIYAGRCDSDSDVDVEQCKLVADIESGLTDVSWIGDTQRLILACDSGIKYTRFFRKFFKLKILCIVYGKPVSVCLSKTCHLQKWL